MSNGIKRIGKGLFAIFMIKLSLVVGVLAFQACQTESNSYKEIAEVKNNFLDAIYESREQIKKISLKNSLTSGYDDTKVDFIAKENDEDFVNWKQICLGNIQQDSINAGTNSTTDLTNIDTTDINTVGDLFDLADGTGTRPIVVNNNDDLNDDDTDETPIISFDICFNIPTQPTLEALEPSIVAAKEYFYSKQFSDDEILEILDGEDESNLVPLVMALVAEEEQSNNSNVSSK